jgi:ribosome-associated protein
VLETGALTSIGDYFVICSGRSDTQVQAIAEGVRDHLSALGVEPLSVEGMERGQWVLIDYGDVVVHVQHEEERQFYALERLWRDCPLIDLPADVTSATAG